MPLLAARLKALRARRAPMPALRPTRVRRESTTRETPEAHRATAELRRPVVSRQQGRRLTFLVVTASRALRLHSVAPAQRLAAAALRAALPMARRASRAPIAAPHSATPRPTRVHPPSISVHLTVHLAFLRPIVAARRASRANAVFNVFPTAKRASSILTAAAKNAKAGPALRSIQVARRRAIRAKRTLIAARSCARMDNAPSGLRIAYKRATFALARLIVAPARAASQAEPASGRAQCRHQPLPIAPA